MSNKTCFIISAIGEEGTEIRKIADEKYDLVFEPTLTEMEYVTIRADRENTPNSISRGIVSRLINSDLVLADVSDSNPNVFYELAIRNAVKKPVIVIKSLDQKLPFDIYDRRAITLDMSNNRAWVQAKKQLKEYIINAEEDPTAASESILSDFAFSIDKNKIMPSNEELIMMVKDIQDELRKNRTTKTDSSSNLNMDEYFLVDTTPLLGVDGQILAIRYKEYPNFVGFLNHVWFSFNNRIPAFTYTKNWILKDTESGRLFDTMAHHANGEPTDEAYNSLKQVGIFPGMKLVAIKISSSEKI